MNVDVSEGGAPPLVAHAPPANDEVAKVEHPRAWITACKGLGLINLVAESAEELVKRVHTHRAHNEALGEARLVAFDVIDNTDDGQQAVIWFDPALVQAVLNEYKRPRVSVHFPPVGLTPEDVEQPLAAVVVVESEPDEE